MTGYQYIYDVRSQLRNNHITDEDLLTERQIEFWIVAQRSTWIERRDSAYINIDHSLAQVLTESVISIDRSMLPDRVEAGYRILRTNRKLPRMINFTSWDGVINAGPIDMASPRFNHCEYNEAINSGNGRFNKDQIYSFILDDYLFIVSKSISNSWYLISQVGVMGIFENPRDLGNFIHVTGDPCWSLSQEYPISLDLWNYMKDQIKTMNIDMLLKVPVDKTNDDNDSKNNIP
jgi:hypothetical protein